jgi:hypothetical protein
MRTSTVLVAGLALAALTVVAEAQQGPNSLVPGSSRIGQAAAAASDKLNSEGPKVKANDKAYNSALRNLPDKQFDPWRGVR